MKKRSFEYFCPERYVEIENYELAKADNFKGWICHHRLGEHCFTKDQLIAFGMYFNVTPGELKFVTKKEHTLIHIVGKPTMKGKHHTEATRKRMSESHKGKKNPTLSKRNTANKGKHQQIRSDFGQKFFDHFKLHFIDDPALYHKEKGFYIRHGKVCRWEV